MKLTNFGILRIVKDRTPIWKIAGSKGWMAPEAYKIERFTCAMDLFSLGLCFGFDLTDGFHHYGHNKEERIVSIKNAKSMILTVEQLKNVDDAFGVLKLISSMLHVEPSKRPTVSQVLSHPFLSTQARDLGIDSKPFIGNMLCFLFVCFYFLIVYFFK